MWGHRSQLFAAAAIVAAGIAGASVPASAVTGGSGSPSAISNTDELPLYLQCVPYARQISGIQIYGDAWTWWSQADGKYQRGERPRVGAVMAFKPHGNMKLGHVAAVSKIVDSRTVLLRHANWSPINGRRGQIEDDVRAIDVSEENDWSEVRVWYDPIQSIGGTAWPVSGFIYNEKPGTKSRGKSAESRELAAAKPAISAPAAPTAKAGRRDVIGEIIADSKRK